MNYDADVIKVRYDFMKDQLPDVLNQLEKDGMLGCYLEMIKDDLLLVKTIYMISL